MKKEELYRIKLVSVLGFLLVIFLAFNISVFAVEDGIDDTPSEGKLVETVLEIEEPAVTSNNLAEPEELLDDYIEVLTKKYAESHDTVSFEPKEGIIVDKLRGSKLTGPERRVYEYLKERIEEVARGENIDEDNEENNGLTAFTVDYNAIYSPEKLATRYTEEDLGVEIVVNDEITDDAVEAVSDRLSFDMRKVLTALLCDYPYHMFWFDKTKGVVPDKECYVEAVYVNDRWEAYCIPNDSIVTFYFAVSRDYAPDYCYIYDFDGNGTKTPIQTDIKRIQLVGVAVENAMGVVTVASEENTDYDKLDYYRGWICNEVEYNDAAMEEDWDYGDPWQLIYAFDGKEDTKAIVCEGYSKAFKYLCDLTTFGSDIDCRLVTGDMDGGTGAGPHMWNLVEINNANYLVDVTNCDKGTVGADTKLFMVGNNNATTEEVTEGNVTVTAEKYTFTNSSHGLSFDVSYTYDVDTVNSFDEDERQLCSTDYVPEPKCDHNYQEVPNTAVSPTCTQAGKEADMKCSLCNNVKKGATIAALGHDWKDATCTTPKTCERCNEKEGEALGHKWDEGVVTEEPSLDKEGVMTYTCTVDGCGATKTEAIAKLPKPIAVPVGKTLTYNTKSQTGVDAGEGYTLSGTKSATNAGSYTATATLNSGYIWADRTTTAKKINWTINQAVYKVAIPTGKTLTYNGKTQTGVASGANYSLSGTFKATAAGTYSAKATLTDNVNKNYTNEWADGTTTAKTVDWKIDKAVCKVKIPTGKNLSYTGKKQTGVASGANYTLAGTIKATKAGTYAATAKLKTNANYTYKWADGTTAAKIIKWSIKKKNTLAVKAKTANVNYTTLKKKNVMLKVGKLITFTKKGQGTLTYAKVSGNAKITINKKTGAVTVKKGLKKGNYKVKVKVTAAGNSSYKAASKTIAFTAKVK